MFKDIIEARPLEKFRLFLRFEDGTAGEINIADFVRFDGVFAPLNDPAQFARVTVNPELGTVVWPCGADLDPDVLYARVTGAPLPSFEARTER
jgi:hypothetical protein